MASRESLCTHQTAQLHKCPWCCPFLLTPFLPLPAWICTSRGLPAFGTSFHRLISSIPRVKMFSPNCFCSRSLMSISPSGIARIQIIKWVVHNHQSLALQHLRCPGRFLCLSVVFLVNSERPARPSLLENLYLLPTSSIISTSDAHLSLFQYPLISCKSVRFQLHHTSTHLHKLTEILGGWK